MRDQVLISPISYPTYYQMNAMFWGAAVFNQPLLVFDTAAVTIVSVCLFGFGV